MSHTFDDSAIINEDLRVVVMIDREFGRECKYILDILEKYCENRKQFYATPKDIYSFPIGNHVLIQ